MFVWTVFMALALSDMVTSGAGPKPRHLWPVAKIELQNAGVLRSLRAGHYGLDFLAFLWCWKAQTSSREQNKTGKANSSSEVGIVSLNVSLDRCKRIRYLLIYCQCARAVVEFHRTAVYRRPKRLVGKPLECCHRVRFSGARWGCKHGWRSDKKW